ncbi:hypothetical protein E2986_11500 [Frieseomelitta varia]|uniref:Uncharacterized protein n=1 Tax=Frieseomelitta varia TaxID=561572 RepID=A0A833VYF3_9HYME|nr:hypothetical protein E2986_11500 [Frieseomelitta varia]
MNTDKYITATNSSVDESLLLYKGRRPFKRNRFDIKYFVLCDCKNGCVLNFIIHYIGNHSEINEKKKNLSENQLKLKSHYWNHNLREKIHFILIVKNLLLTILSDKLKDIFRLFCETINTKRRRYEIMLCTQKMVQGKYYAANVKIVTWNSVSYIVSKYRTKLYY